MLLLLVILAHVQVVLHLLAEHLILELSDNWFRRNSDFLGNRDFGGKISSRGAYCYLSVVLVLVGSAVMAVVEVVEEIQGLAGSAIPQRWNAALPRIALWLAHGAVPRVTLSNAL